MKKENFMWDVDRLFALVPEMKPIPKVKLSNGIKVFKFQSASYGEKEKTWVFAAMGTPTTERPEGGYPAVVLVHGGDGYVFEEWMLYWMQRGFVTIAIDMFGNELNEALQKVDNPESGPKEHNGSNYDEVKDPKKSWVYHSVHNVIMAHNLLRARKDVDVGKIVATGISWGGYIINIVSGVDQRFAAFAPMYGAGFVYEDGFWTNGYGTFGGEKDRQVWIELYDPSSYLPYSTKPMLYVSGIDDGFFSTVSRAKSAALVKGDVYYSQRSNLPHGHCWGLTPEIYAFFRHILYGEKTFAKVCEAIEHDGVVTLRTENALYRNVQLVYTVSEDEDSHRWEWKTMPLSKDDGAYSCKLPDGVTAYVFETVGDSITDNVEELVRQTTPVYFRKNNLKRK